MEEKNMAEKKFFIQWWVWLLLVVTLVLIIGMSLYVVSEQRKLIAELESQVGSPPAVEETEATPPATNEYAGWKTYENNELGISFKYPASLKIIDKYGNNSDSKGYLQFVDVNDSRSTITEGAEPINSYFMTMSIKYPEAMDTECPDLNLSWPGREQLEYQSLVSELIIKEKYGQLQENSPAGDIGTAVVYSNVLRSDDSCVAATTFAGEIESSEYQIYKKILQSIAESREEILIVPY